MDRLNFEDQFKQRGVCLSEYGGECYFGETEDYSLVLAPYPAAAVNKAALAIRTKTPERRKDIVSGFLRAAGVQPNGDIAEALKGQEYRGEIASKQVTVAVVDDEFIVTIFENPLFPETTESDRQRWAAVA